MFRRLLWSERQIERLRPWALLGLLYMTVWMIASAVGWSLKWLFASGVFGGMFGAVYGSLDSYREQRGLWMLAALWFVIFVSFYALVTYETVLDAVAGRQAKGWRLAMDWSFATAIVAATVRLTASIGYLNWTRFRRG